MKIYAAVALAAVIAALFYFSKHKQARHDLSFNAGVASSRLPASDARKEEPEAKPPHHVHHFSAQSPSGYSPAQIRHAYGVDQVSSDGTGQTIAIVDAYGSKNIQSDIKTFDSYFKLPAAQLRVAFPEGHVKQTDSSWALETSLDVEWAHALAPGAAILLVVAKSASYPDLISAVDYALSQGATQVSMSWGSGEFQGETSYDSHFNASAAGFFASSGDSGAGAMWPAASPNVTGVGGTTLYLDGSGNRLQPETAWSGSGGGVSAFEAQPGYQSGVQNYGMRTVPDVSFDGDPATGFPVYDSSGYYGQSGWFQVGGTSAGAPQWAAITALAVSKRTSPLGSVNSALYSLATPPNLSSYFNDIVSGCNGTTSLLTCAQTGYDEVTGLGSPQAVPLVSGIQSL